MIDKVFRISKFGSLSALSDVCDGDGRMLNSEVVDKLNKLYEENEQLQQKLKDIYSFKGSNCRCVKYE